MAIIFSSCKKQDKTPPSIYILDPEINSKARSGSQMPVQVTITDDREIAYYEIEISIGTDNDRDEAKIIAPFYFGQLYPVNTNTVIQKDSLFIVDTVAAGDYIFTVNAVDLSGNFSMDSVQFNLESNADTLAPVIDSLLFPDTIIMQNGLEFYVGFSDDISLAYYFIEITDNESGNNLLYRKYFANGTNFANNHLEPVSIDTGRHLIKVQVRDWANNKTEQTFNRFFY